MKFKFLSSLAVLAFLTPAFAAEPASSDQTLTKKLPQLLTDGTPVTQDAKPGLVTSYADVLEPVQLTVVTINSTKTVRQPINPFYRQLFGDQAPPDRESKEKGLGSGVIISADGYILTNNHVVEGADDLEVQLTDERKFKVKVIGADPKTDIAVIKIDATDLPAITLADSDKIRVGDVVFAVGNPLGVGQTVTMGIVSAKSRHLGILEDVAGYEDFIQTDAAINMGNSGGALVDAKGRLVGINSAILSPSSGNIGIGFTVPINLAASIMHSLIETGTVSRGFLGVNVDPLTADLAETLGLKKDTKGVIITEAREDTPAMKAGLKQEDVILSIDGKNTSSRDELRLLVAQKLPGTKVKVRYLRDGKETIVEVTLGTLPTDLAVNDTKLLPGVSASPLTEELRRKFKITDDRIEGIVVTEMDPKSPYAESLQVGMVILQIRRNSITDLDSAKKAMKPGRNLFLTYFRGALGYVPIEIK